MSPARPGSASSALRPEPALSALTLVPVRMLPAALRPGPVLAAPTVLLTSRSLPVLRYRRRMLLP
jgi:hypothetical protein